MELGSEPRNDGMRSGICHEEGNLSQVPFTLLRGERRDFLPTRRAARQTGSTGD